MMNNQREVTGHTKPVLYWIADNDLSQSLHAGTWLETTRHLREMGWVVDLFSPHSQEGEREVRGVKVRFFAKPNLFFVQQLLYHWKIWRWMLGSETTSAVVLFHEISAGWMLVFQRLNQWLWKRDFSFVMDTRTLPMEPEENLALRTKLRRKYVTFCSQHGAEWFDGRMVITPAMAEVLGIPQEKLWATWSSGVVPELFAACEDFRQFPQAAEPIVLIYIGCMHVERNLLTMCEAVVAANEKQQNFHLILVGEGNDEERLRGYAEHHPDSIQFHGSVPSTEIPAWLAKAHVGLLPFPDEEKFRVSSPLKLFEYLAAGMPVMATHIRCHTDVMPEDAPYVFWAYGADRAALEQALVHIQREKEDLAIIARSTTENIDQWTWRHSAEQISAGLLRHFPKINGGIND
jgi:glycosyltransferase involved in cell wall biosynthesis